MTAQVDPENFEPRPFGVRGQPVDIKPRAVNAEAFPIDKMPPRLAGAIEAIVDIVQIPMSIAAQSVLGACALVAQTRLMIEMPTREVAPCSLFLFTVAASGDRKSSCDKLALGPVYEYERELRQHYEPLAQQFTI